MDVGNFLAVFGAVVGSAGIAGALSTASQFTESVRARKAVEATTDALNASTGDAATTESAKLAAQVAIIQLAAVTLIRVPAHRLLRPFALLLLIFGVASAALAVLAAVVLALTLPSATMPSSFLLTTWLFMSVGLFLAYRSAIAERREEFVRDVLATGGTSLEMAAKYNSALRIGNQKDLADAASSLE